MDSNKTIQKKLLNAIFQSPEVQHKEASHSFHLADTFQLQTSHLPTAALAANGRRAGSPAMRSITSFWVSRSEKWKNTPR